MKTIDIGFKIIPKLYFNLIDGNEMPFEIDKITKIENINNVTIISYQQSNNLIVEFPVKETMDSINEHIEKANLIKNACIDFIKNFE